jgi:hypothetical protein
MSNLSENERAEFRQEHKDIVSEVRSNNLIGGIFIGLAIAVVAFAVFTGGFDRCGTLGPMGNKVLICGFRI